MALGRGISGRLLILTVIVVMLVEVVIFVPSVSRFRLDYLEERVVRAEIAALTVMAAPEGMVPPELETQLLENAGVLNVVVRKDARRILALPGIHIDTMVKTFDLRDAGALGLIRDALGCLFASKNGGVIRVISDTGRGVFELVEITLPSRPLREAMLDYGLRILQLSLIISLITAAFVFLVVRRFVVSPMMKVVESMKAFEADEADERNVIRPRSRLGEVAEAERALASMQRDVLASMRERRRLASLGEAVAKINHDLRNMLAAGHLMADRLESSSDPMVVRVLPKLIASLDRAIALCQRTLDFGRAEESAPEPRRVDLRRLVAEVAEGLGLEPGQGRITVDLGVAEGETLIADPDQLFRVLANLMRNAAEAIRAEDGCGEIVITCESRLGEARITVRDTGPGMPAKALENIFRPFSGGARKGGTGLGLAIAAELVRANGGRLELVESTTAGTEFLITLPQPPAA